MYTETLNWTDFKRRASDHIEKGREVRLCRGQANSLWQLATSLNRCGKSVSVSQYFQLLPKMADMIGTHENRVIDVTNNEVNGSFLAYLQHHGFPTPLLDWTLSPYIAAFFAFKDIDATNPQSNHVAIYVFDYLRWTRDYSQIYDHTEKSPHVSVLTPKNLGNRRQMKQQGMYTWTNVEDIEGHIIACENAKETLYLEKYNISVKERNFVMTDLESMGITEYSLFGNTDALCRQYKEFFFRADKVGKTPSEKVDLYISSSSVGEEKQEV